MRRFEKAVLIMLIGIPGHCGGADIGVGAGHALCGSNQPRAGFV